MRRAEFHVPSDLMEEFTEELVGTELENAIIGTNKYGEIIIEVCYERDEADHVDELEKTLERLKEEAENQEEEEETED
jgi:hypothetical protein